MTRAIGCILLLTSVAAAQSPDRATRDQTARETRRDATVRVVERVGPAVANVSIHKRPNRSAATTPGKTTPASGLHHGSAVVIDPAGYLLTNAHVLSPGAIVRVSLPGRPELPARVLALQPEVDLALIKVDAATPLPFVRLAAGGDVLIGETCIAIGNPFGLGNSVTRGVISATERRLKHKGRALLGGFLQTDAAINPGNSGGALVNIDGDLIGINTAIHAGGHGIGFAIPPSRIRSSLAGLTDPLALRGRWLGWTLKETKAGVVVHKVVPGGPAARGGVAVGDRIVAAGPRPVDSIFGVQRAFLGKSLAPVRLALRSLESSRRGVVLTPSAPPWRAILRTRLGLEARTLTPTLAWWLGITLPRGVVVRGAAPGSPAAGLGLRRGDVLIRVARKPGQGRPILAAPLANERSLERFLRQCQPRQQVLVELVRDGQRMVGKLRLR